MFGIRRRQWRAVEEEVHRCPPQVDCAGRGCRVVECVLAIGARFGEAYGQGRIRVDSTDASRFSESYAGVRGKSMYLAYYSTVGKNVGTAQPSRIISAHLSVSW